MTFDKFEIPKLTFSKPYNEIAIGVELKDKRYSKKYPELKKDTDYIMLTYKDGFLKAFESKKYPEYTKLAKEFLLEEDLQEEIERLEQICSDLFKNPKEVMGIKDGCFIMKPETEPQEEEQPLEERAINIREFNELVFDNNLEYETLGTLVNTIYTTTFDNVKYTSILEHKEEVM